LPAIAKDLYASPIGEPGAEGHVYVLKDPGNGYNINKLLEEKQQHSHLSWEREHMLRDIPPEYIIGRRRVENGRFVGEFEYNPNAVWRIDIGGGRSVPVKEVRGSFPESPDAVFVPQKAGHTDRFAQDVSGKPRFTHELVQDQVTKKYFIQPIVEASE
jgi:hypothetical protein